MAGAPYVRLTIRIANDAISEHLRNEGNHQQTFNSWQPYPDEHANPDYRLAVVEFCVTPGVFPEPQASYNTIPAETHLDLMMCKIREEMRAKGE